MKKDICALGIVASFLSSAAVSGELEVDSLFGPLNYGPPSDLVHASSSPVVESPLFFSKPTSSTRNYMANNPRTVGYLSENLLHGCNLYVHALLDRIRTDKIENKLAYLSNSVGIPVRVIVGEVSDRNDMLRYQRLLRLGVDVRVLNRPILHNFVICDGKETASGIIEAYDDNLVSYGLSLTNVSYGDSWNASNYEVLWQSYWGKSDPLALESTLDNPNWRLFGRYRFYDKERYITTMPVGEEPKYHLHDKTWSYGVLPDHSSTEGALGAYTQEDRNESN